MSTNVFQTLPRTPSQELRFEIFQRAALRHQRALTLRTGAILAVSAATMFMAAYSITVGRDQTLNSATAMCGISGFASLITIVNAWSTRLQRDGCWIAYCEYLERTSGGSSTDMPPV